MSRKPFNWSLLDRASLYSMMYRLRSSIVDKELPAKEIQQLLSAHIKYYLPVRVRMDSDPSHETGVVYIGGAYYADYDVDGRRQIEVVFSYRDTDAVIKVNDNRWRRMCTLFADTVLHEIIHMRQYRTREFKLIPGYESTAYSAKHRKEQEYYGHPDEMGAFSFNIACELYNKFGNDFDAIKAYLDSNQSKRCRKTTYHRILKVFDWDQNHPVIFSLKKKIIRNLPYAQAGKPFKTNNHLTY